MLNEIISLFSDKEGYITDIENVILYLKNKQLENKTIILYLIEIYNYNRKAYKTLNEKNDLATKLKNAQSSSEISKPKINPKEKSNNTAKTNTIEINIDHYISLLSNMKPNQDLTALLPKHTDNNFDFVINKLLLHYIKNEVILTQMLEETDKTDKELISYINNEIIENKKLINAIIDYRDSRIKDNLQSDNCNEITLIFTDDIIDDFDKNSIPRELYGDFSLLLESLKNGNPKNSKSFKPGDGNYTIYEVKHNKARILFDIVNNNTYCLYFAFIKDGNDLYYHNTLVKRSTEYYENKNLLLKDFYSDKDRENFISKQKTLEDNISKKLVNSVKGL